MQLDQILDRLDFSSLKSTERTRYINRLCNVVAVIEESFPHVARPEQIKLKHCQYFRNVWLPAHSGSERTKAEHMRALGLLVMALRRDARWLGALGIRQTSGKGGRPSKVGVRQTKKF
jgi:hypothetical protein